MRTRCCAYRHQERPGCGEGCPWRHGRAGRPDGSHGLTATVQADRTAIQGDKGTVHSDAQNLAAAEKGALGDTGVVAAQTVLTAAIAVSQADRTTVQGDKATVNTDVQNLAAAEKAALSDATVVAAQASLAAAILKAQPLIKADRAAINAVHAADDPVVNAAEQALRKDIRNGASAARSRQIRPL